MIFLSSLAYFNTYLLSTYHVSGIQLGIYIHREIKCIAMGFPDVASGKEPTWQWRRYKRCGFNPWVGKNPLEKDMATHSSILAWRIPWTEEPGGLQFIVSQEVGHNWSDLACMHAQEFPAKWGGRYKKRSSHHSKYNQRNKQRRSTQPILKAQKELLEETRAELSEAIIKKSTNKC